MKSLLKKWFYCSWLDRGILKGYSMDPGEGLLKSTPKELHEDGYSAPREGFSQSLDSYHAQWLEIQGKGKWYPIRKV